MRSEGNPPGARFAFALALFVLLALGACASLPPLKPPLPGAQVAAPFPQGRWQLVHRIEARFPGNHKALMMGALELDSETGHFTCALMTVEGFTLFSASQTDRLSVARAVPPFDGPGFAEGLMADLDLLFFPPHDARLETGVRDDGPVRRYLHHDGRATDIVTTDAIAAGAHRFRIDRYTAETRHIRRAELTMKASSTPAQGIASEILLEALGDAGYTLKLDLIDAVPLGPVPDNITNGSTPKDSP